MKIVVGGFFHIKEWDDSLDVVEVVSRPYDQFGQEGDVLMRYPDGVTHRVSARYFRSIVVMVN